MVLSIVLAVIIFSVLVISHEFGHFLLAKRNGIDVEEFSVGFGPRIISREKNGTRYSLKAIPFGGSCQMVGMYEEDDSENSFTNKSPWVRFAVVAAGPVFNFLLAFILSLLVLSIAGTNEPEVYYVSPGYGAEAAGIEEGDVIKSIDGHNIVLGRDIDLYFINHPMDGSDITIEYERGGETYVTSMDPKYEAYMAGFSYYDSSDEAEITEVTEGLPMAEAGVEAGDIILSINGADITCGSDIMEYFTENPLQSGSEVTFVCERKGEPYEVTVTPAYYVSTSIGFSASGYRNTDAGALAVIKGSFSEVRYWMSYTVTSLRMLFTGRAGLDDLSGPVGIVNMVNEVVEESRSDGALYVFLNMANFCILLGVNIGIINLLPIPGLDGGRLVFIVIEIVRRKPVAREKEGIVNGVGMALLMVLMVVILFNDVLKFVR